MSCINLSDEEKKRLYEVASLAIEQGLVSGERRIIDLSGFSDTLCQAAATFVTVLKQGELRGCIGVLGAIRPLVQDVSHNAFSAAFEDPRFAPLKRDEWRLCALHISVLTQPRLLPVTSEQDLAGKLKVGEDGLILSWHGHRATFLPSVWEQLPKPEDFIGQLKRKAGLDRKFWDKDIKAEIYQATYI
ncbi:AmmeMemoRadiSam system protein A [Hahella sp. KA22]|uniref:AmmeMemoRadiSam system protein A n=1 Tax=Hahella sp. KA22 TaxID=1628392 RepID=UPI000FDD492E|nr:AmmeMemoRadiSam system protein A [Hahella sp. KA22]AZZ94376.1 AmmeMemoRadiSam system protein A [Hahella sp. KA22]QAY57750.1 AmmeMemoRadiSam system protein A [Hahella sp. KA22]